MNSCDVHGTRSSVRQQNVVINQCLVCHVHLRQNWNKLQQQKKTFYIWPECSVGWWRGLTGLPGWSRFACHTVMWPVLRKQYRRTPLENRLNDIKQRLMHNVIMAGGSPRHTTQADVRCHVKSVNWYYVIICTQKMKKEHTDICVWHTVVWRALCLLMSCGA